MHMWKFNTQEEEARGPVLNSITSVRPLWDTWDRKENKGIRGNRGKCGSLAEAFVHRFFSLGHCYAWDKVLMAVFLQCVPMPHSKFLRWGVVNIWSKVQQEGCEFKARLGYIVKTCLKRSRKQGTRGAWYAKSIFETNSEYKIVTEPTVLAAVPGAPSSLSPSLLGISVGWGNLKDLSLGGGVSNHSVFFIWVWLFEGRSYSTHGVLQIPIFLSPSLMCPR